MSKQRRYNQTSLLDKAKERGLSTYDLARLMGYTRPYIYMVTGGKTPITDEFIHAATSLFGLSEDALFSWSEEVNEWTKSRIDELRRRMAQGEAAHAVAS